MNPFIRAQKEKKGLLWAGLIALNAPLAMAPIAMTAMDSLAAKIGRQWTKYFGTSKVDLYPPLAPMRQALPENHLLSVMAYEMGRKEGAFLRGISIKDQNDSMNNAFISSSGKNFSLHFDGNPLKNKNGINVAKGVIGHEIGHLSTSTGQNYKKVAMQTSSTYSLLAGASVLGALLDPIKLAAMNLPTEMQEVLSQSLLMDKPLMMGMAAAFSAAALVIPRMARSFMHSTEYIADLRGGEIAGPENMIGTLEAMQKKRSRTEPEAREDGAWPKTAALKKVWDRVARPIDSAYSETHPATEERISLLKKAFYLGDETPPSQAGQPKQTTLPANKDDIRL